MNKMEYKYQNIIFNIINNFLFYYYIYIFIVLYFNNFYLYKFIIYFLYKIEKLLYLF